MAKDITTGTFPIAYNQVLNVFSGTTSEGGTYGTTGESNRGAATKSGMYKTVTTTQIVVTHTGVKTNYLIVGY